MIFRYIKLAWRNLFRNKRRSFIAGTAIGIGLASLIFTDALIIGMDENMVGSATGSFLGEGQIFHEDFKTSRSAEYTVENYKKILKKLEKEEIVENFAPRVEALAMISSASEVKSASMVGIKPSKEQYMSKIDDAITKGSYFKDSNKRDIVIGYRLAELLGVGLGDRIVVTVSQAETGDLSQELFRVSGIFNLNIKEMDRGMVFVRIDKAQEMLNINDNVHIISINFTSTKYGRNKKLPFWAKYSQGKNEAQGWVELMPQLATALKLSNFSSYIVGVILFGIVALVIINTLFMSLYERIFEFGVLKSVGTRPFGIFQLILYEAGSLSILSIFLGIILGIIILWITSATGIDYTGIEYAGVTFTEKIYPIAKFKQFVIYPFWVFVFTLIAGIYPAVHAAKINPADALRKSM
ncbi:MAG: ABC transporter permease [Elusimicrobiota bacterium]